jgi:hypothetical protein
MNYGDPLQGNVFRPYPSSLPSTCGNENSRLQIQFCNKNEDI